MILGNSFGYFSSDDQDRVVLTEVMRVLKPDGRIIIDLTDGDYMRNNYSERSWEWMDDSNFVCRERQLSDDRTRLISREIVSVTNKGVIRDQFYQERLYSRSELHSLLSQIGFCVSETSQHSLNAKSKRNEDLGMMENRMIITATKSDVKNTTLLKNLKSATYPNVTVLLGDASQACVGKLNNTWNAEDFETRKKLFDALSKFGLTDIQTLDSHKNVLSTLIENKPEFVLNLCDEGWNNDALKELHIPALLEMLEIPFSGAGPNCLAYCYDKGLVNRSAEAIGIDTPQEINFISSKVQVETSFSELKSQVGKMGYPAFIKPVKGDNSLGITCRSIVQNDEDLEKYILELKEMGIDEILIQEYLSGEEYGIGMIGNIETGFQFLPTIRVDFQKILSRNLPPILGYESKWDPQSPYWSEIRYEEAKLQPKIQAKLEQSCIDLWKRFGCRDYARFDFRSNSSGNIKLLEVNPNPGWCWDGKFAYMARLAGMEYHELLENIIKASCTRLGIKIE